MAEPVAEIVIPVPARSWQQLKLSANDRFHWSERNQRTQWWRANAGFRARSIRVPKVAGRARVEVWFRLPSNRRMEVANLQPTSKAIIDGLVDAGVFADDADKFVVGPDNRREPVNGPHQVRVCIFQIEEEV